MPELKDPLALSPDEMLAMDYGQKQNLLLMIAGAILQRKTRLIEVSSEYQALKAELGALKDAGNFIQSEMKATQASGGKGNF